MTHRGMKSLIVKVYWQLGCRWLEKERAGSFPGSGQSCPVGVGRPRPASRLLGSAWGVRGTLSLDRPRVASAPTWLPLGCWWATSKGTSLVESRLPATWPAAWNWVECQDCRWGRWMHFGVSHWMSGGPVCPRWPPSAPEELLATSPQEPGGCDWCLGTCPKPGPGGHSLLRTPLFAAGQGRPRASPAPRSMFREGRGSVPLRVQETTPAREPTSTSMGRPSHTRCQQPSGPRALWRPAAHLALRLGVSGWPAGL